MKLGGKLNRQKLLLLSEGVISIFRRWKWDGSRENVDLVTLLEIGCHFPDSIS